MKKRLRERIHKIYDYERQTLKFQVILRSIVIFYLLLLIIEIISSNHSFFYNHFKWLIHLNMELSVFVIMTLYCIVLIIRILLKPQVAKAISLTILNYFLNLVILNIEIVFLNKSSVSYILNNSPILNFYTSLLIQVKAKDDLVQLITIGIIGTLCLYIGALLVTDLFIHYCNTTQLGNSLEEKLQYQSFFLTLIFIVSFLFSAVVGIFYSKVIATLIGTLFLYILHTIIKDILPISRELDHDLKIEYKPSILGKLALCIIDTSSAFLIFSYGLAQLITNKYTVYINVKKTSPLYSKIIKNINLSKYTDIDHIQSSASLLMSLSEENKFWLIFITIFLVEGILSLALFHLLRRNIRKYAIIQSFVIKLTKKDS